MAISATGLCFGLPWLSAAVRQSGKGALTLGRYQAGMTGWHQQSWIWGICAAVLLAAPALALRLAPVAAGQMQLKPPAPAQGMPMVADIPLSGRPVRFSGVVSDGLYASLRASGVSIAVAQQSIKALASHVDFANDISVDTRFDLLLGNGGSDKVHLLYISLSRPGRTVQLVPFMTQGATRWHNLAGTGGGMTGVMSPVPAAHLSSGFGLRWHPLLGYSRFHKGVDYAAAAGTPIQAVADGMVAQAGWAGGYGQMVRLSHPGGIETGYAHMSHIAVSPGARVRQGQTIGYVGTTGLSTGPHLHFEIYRQGRAVDPAEVERIDQTVLSPAQIRSLRQNLQKLLAQAVIAPHLGG